MKMYENYFFKNLGYSAVEYNGAILFKKENVFNYWRERLLEALQNHLNL